MPLERIENEGEEDQRTSFLQVCSLKTLKSDVLWSGWLVGGRAGWRAGWLEGCQMFHHGSKNVIFTNLRPRGAEK